MAQVTVKINGFAYPVGCEDGQEAHLQAMASRRSAAIPANRGCWCSRRC
jgi:cell division protein ZapA (FtsZ GTPase activity inhibitor)